MKTLLYTTKYIWIIALAIGVGLLIVTITYAGGCVETSEKIYRRAIRWGYEARLARGYFKDIPHQWVEYYAKGKWRAWDESIWYIGKSWHTSEEIGYRDIVITNGGN